MFILKTNFSLITFLTKPGKLPLVYVVLFSCYLYGFLIEYQNLFNPKIFITNLA